MSINPGFTPNETEVVTRATEHVQCLAGLIGPRHLGRPSSMDAAVAYITRDLEDSGYEVIEHPYECNGQTAINLEAVIPGTDLADEVVILGAHYDTVPTTPGADDNASAVAGLLEVARLLQGHTFRRTLRFLAFANEEPPHFYTDTMGSQVYARACRKRGDRIHGMICLEMIGYFDTAPGSQKYPPLIPPPIRWLLPKRGNFIGAVSDMRSIRLLWQFHRGFKRAVKFPMISLPLPTVIHEIRLSDHSSFWDQHYPALMLTDTSFFRNPHYHEPTDVPNTLDYDRLAKVIVGTAGGVARVAGIS